MTDHELCMAAAKAAGYTVTAGLTYCWNPLDDDADAFLLMVDCGIDVEKYDRFAAATTYTAEAIADWFHEDYGADKHAAYRRVIVRAAAAMGEKG